MPEEAGDRPPTARTERSQLERSSLAGKGDGRSCGVSKKAISMSHKTKDQLWTCATPPSSEMTPTLSLVSSAQHCGHQLQRPWWARGGQCRRGSSGAGHTGTGGSLSELRGVRAIHHYSCSLSEAEERR